MHRMKPIRELLDQIRWDPRLKGHDFEIAYYDHQEDQLIRLPFNKISLESDGHFFFEFIDREGAGHSVPLHRIKSVYQDGELIWHRDY
jgi:uncharacterized protein (UPF0248 family)